MKSELLSLCLLAVACFASAADAPKPQPANLNAVLIAADKHTLLVRYEVAGTAVEQRLIFARDIADFRYCHWMGDSGIAIVARTGEGEAAEYFFSAFYLSPHPANHKPLKIPAPKGHNPVLGIGNTGGDSVVITAVQHSRNPSDSISGWTYIDNCPATDGGLVIGHVTPFTVPAERPKSK